MPPSKTEVLHIKILVACEESQAVTNELRKLGHEAYSCDIIECSGGHPEWHIKGDCIPLINGNCQFQTMDGSHHTQSGKWDILIAHPPCTYLTNAGARWLFKGGKLNEERYALGMEAKEFFMKFISADCDKIAVENPMPSSVFELPKYSQVVEPYMFGHPATKKTRFWLKGLPLLVETDNVGRPEKQYFQKRDGTWRTTSWEMQQRGGKDRAKNRSKTFPGIAKAMAEQWAGQAQ